MFLSSETHLYDSKPLSSAVLHIWADCEGFEAKILGDF